MSKFYTFKIVLCGSGSTPEEAWKDAVEGFNMDSGLMPEDYEEHEDDGYPQELT